MTPWTAPQQGPRSRTPVLLALFLFLSISFFYSQQQPRTMTASTSDLAGWHSRATETEPFAPAREDLALAILHSTPVNPEGFTLALFAPDRCVDAAGRTLRLTAADYAGLVALGQQLLALPRPFQWRVKSLITSRPIDNIFVADGSGQVKVGVYNWNKQTADLDPPVEGRTELPAEIHALLELAQESSEAGRPTDEPDIIRRVRRVLDE